MNDNKRFKKCVSPILDEHFNLMSPTAKGSKEKIQDEIAKAIAQEFNCACCLDVMVEATMLTPCGHTFCRECIFRRSTSSATRNAPLKKFDICPTCRDVIRDTAPNRVVNCAIEAITSRSRDLPVGYFSKDDIDDYYKRCPSTVREPGFGKIKLGKTSGSGRSRNIAEQNYGINLQEQTLRQQNGTVEIASSSSFVPPTHRTNPYANRGGTGTTSMSTDEYIYPRRAEMFHQPNTHVSVVRASGSSAAPSTSRNPYNQSFLARRTIVHVAPTNLARRSAHSSSSSSSRENPQGHSRENPISIT